MIVTTTVKKQASAFMIALAITLPAGLYAQKPSDAHQVITAMHHAYDGKWYPVVSFNQKTVFYKDGKPDRTETWYEIMKPDKGLLIKFGSMDSDDGMIFRQDSQFVYKDDVLVGKKRVVHELLVLGFSVYVDNPDVTAAKLTDAGFDLGKFATETIDGVDHYVIGDPATAQVWIESKRLLFTKLRKVKSGSVSEVVFNKYRKLQNGWIEQEVIFYKNGVVTMSEVYQDITVPATYDESLISNDRFSAKRW